MLGSRYGLKAAVLAFSLLGLPRLVPAGDVIYVNASSTGGNGSSWSAACPDLQQALAQTPNGAQVWVAAGTYRPTTTGDRDATFLLGDGVAVYGGFAGHETALSQRDWHLYVTTLSGNIGNTNDNADNCKHVVTIEANATALLDGFTIAEGRGGEAYPDSYGAGIFNEHGSPILRHCRFSGNSGECGAGLFNGSGSHPLLSDCTFDANTATNRGGGVYSVSAVATLEACTFYNNTANVSGGGMAMYSTGGTLTDCSFQQNVAQMHGGGLCCFATSSPALRSCRFEGNTVFNNYALSNDGGGGAYFDGAAPSIVDSLFADNIADNRGGALYFSGSSPIVARCTLRDNYASDNGGGVYNLNGNSRLTNCRLIGNFAGTGGGIHHAGGTLILANSVLNGNRAFSVGGAFYTLSGSPLLAGCTLANNSSPVACGGVYIAGGTPALRNVIVWANSSGGSINESSQITLGGGTLQVAYACIQGWTGALGGEHIVATLPGFRNADGIDGLPGNEDDDLRLTFASPCVDAGDNSAVPADFADLDDDGDTVEPTPFDLEGRPRFQKITDGAAETAAVDIGAYELGPFCAADFDRDGHVDALDLTHFTECQSGPALPQTEPACIDADLDGDDDVDQTDFGILQRCLSGSLVPADPLCVN